METPWWRDRSILIPVFSGVAYLTGLVLEWSAAPTAALAVFWIGLVLGASTFAPSAVRNLVTQGKVGIALAARCRPCPG